MDKKEVDNMKSSNEMTTRDKKRLAAVLLNKHPHTIALVRVKGRLNKWADDLERSLGWENNDSRFINAHYLITKGPVFAELISADFATFEGFIKFAEAIGFNWLATLAPDQPAGNPLIERLENEFSIEQLYEMTHSLPGIIESDKRREIPQAYLKRYYEYLNGPRVLEKARENGVESSFGGAESGFLVQQQKLMRHMCDGAITKSQEYGSDVYGLLPAFLEANENEKLRREILWHLGLLRKDQIPSIQLDLGVSTTELKLRHVPRTFWALCWLELMDIINRKDRLIPCVNCGLYFVPERVNEKYCSRRDRNQPVNVMRTCREIGAVKEYERSLDGDAEKRQARREYKKYEARRRRARDKFGEASREHEEASKAFEEFKLTQGVHLKGGREDG